ncbi:MAG: 4-hydroxy-tetrahydrodipicolinate synthase [Alphaproteobacteria bacterium]|nr:4-hydroxy-tetrahydrodipicolinate synthase [Alphaproteobacteria bacterium]
MTFQGVLTALITPFTSRGVDEPALRALVDAQIAGGVSGLVPCGTTGEAPTLDLEEHAEVIRITVDQAAGRVPVMAGIGSNDTRVAVLNAQRAAEAGVAGVLATAPYYNKPTQEGLYRHFRAIAEATDVEVCVYNVPGRTSVNVLPATIARLAEVDGITCVKEATGDLAVASEILVRCGDRLALLSGDDFTTLPFVALGGVGCISVASNVVPDRMAALVAAARAARLDEARALHLGLYPLFRVLFAETNPLPVKTALALMGRCEERFRLPLCEMSEEPRARLAEELGRQGLR